MMVQYVPMNELLPSPVYGCIPVVKIHDLLMWLESRQDATEDNGLHVCVDTLIQEIEAMIERSA